MCRCRKTWCAAASITSSDLRAGSTATRPDTKPPTRGRGLFLLDFDFSIARANGAQASPRRRGGGEGRHAGREVAEPGGETRMLVAPAPREAKVAIAERAGERDLADIGRQIEAGRRRLQHRQRARDLA